MPSKSYTSILSLVCIVLCTSCIGNEAIPVGVTHELVVQNKRITMRSLRIESYSGNKFIKVNPTLANKDTTPTIIYLPCLKIVTDIKHQKVARSSQNEVEFSSFQVPSLSTKRDTITWQIVEERTGLSELAERAVSLSFLYEEECVEKFSPYN